MIGNFLLLGVKESSSFRQLVDVPWATPCRDAHFSCSWACSFPTSIGILCTRVTIFLDINIIPFVEICVV